MKQINKYINIFNSNEDIQIKSTEYLKTMPFYKINTA